MSSRKYSTPLIRVNSQLRHVGKLLFKQYYEICGRFVMTHSWTIVQFPPSKKTKTPLENRKRAETPNHVLNPDFGPRSLSVNRPISPGHLMVNAQLTCVCCLPIIPASSDETATNSTYHTRSGISPLSDPLSSYLRYHFKHYSGI